MHQPFRFDDEDDDLTPGAEVALRHALRHAWARESQARRGRVRVNGHAHARTDFREDENDSHTTIASYPRVYGRVA